jgi:hypothetical protein
VNHLNAGEQIGHLTGRVGRMAAVISVIALLAGPPVAASAKGSAPAVFDAFRGMAGRWQGKSTKGWEDEMSARVIAKDSVVVMRSFEAHPGEEMLTTILMDGQDLTLTHYCVAGNQPRLVASSVSPDGREVTFSFRDGTNLPSRDRGHMDKVIYRFVDDDHFTSRWTWYQDGEERWMEEISYTRLR